MQALGGSSRGLSPRWQRGGRFRARWRDAEQHRNIDRQRCSDSIQQINGHVVFASLNAADRRSIYSGINGKVFLRDLFVGPHPP